MMLSNEDLREAYTYGYEHGQEEGYRNGYEDGQRDGCELNTVRAVPAALEGVSIALYGKYPTKDADLEC